MEIIYKKQKPPSLMNNSHLQGSRFRVLKRAYSSTFGVEDHLDRRCPDAKEDYEEEHMAEWKKKEFFFVMESGPPGDSKSCTSLQNDSEGGSTV